MSRTKVVLGAGAVLAAGAAVPGLARRRPPTVADHGPSPAQSRTVLTDDGVALHVETEGPPDAALSLVLTHGFTARLGEWELQRAALRAARPDVRVVLWDQRGHGRSAWGDLRHATIDQTGRDLGAVLDAIVPAGPVVLAGHSMGGMSVMALARQRPVLIGPRVVGAFLLATSAGGLVSEGLLARAVLALRRTRTLPGLLRGLQVAAPLVERGRRRGTAAGRAYTRRYLFGRDDADPALVKRVQDLLEETPYTVTAAFWATFLEHDEEAALAVLRRVPTTVVVGTHDRLTPAAHSRRLAAALQPDTELVVEPGAGHSVNITRAAVVDTALLRLLDRVADREVSAPAP